MPKSKLFIIVWAQRIYETYIWIECWVKLHSYLYVLGGKIDKVTGEIIYSSENSKKHGRAEQALRKENKTQINFDFNFKPTQKRRFNEYDDLQIYISNNQNYLLTNKGKEGEIDDNMMIEEINFGIINSENLKNDQKTSSNVWISLLDKNLSHVTNKKLDLSYFENQNFYFWMNLNAIFFFKPKIFEEISKEYFGEFDISSNVRALEGITNIIDTMNKRKTHVIINYYNFKLKILIIFNFKKFNRNFFQ